MKRSYHLVFLLVALTLTSCSWFSQDPLKGNLPKDLQEGVLQTGPENWTLFNPVLVNQILKINIQGQKDLSINFTEGEESFYNIQFRFLNDFDKQYEIVMDDNIFEGFLSDSKWDYQADQLTGVLTWKPHPGFNNGRLYQSFDIPISIKLKKRNFPDRNQMVSIDRKIRVYVDKKVFPTSIRKVSVESGINGQTYVRLDDNQFYRSDGLKNLDLSYYDEILLSVLKSNDNMPSELNEIVNYQEVFLSMQNTIIYPIEGLLDRQKNKIDQDIIPFIQQPYYYAEDQELECNTGKFCLLESRSSISIDTDLYLKVYKKPKKIRTNQIYYKLQSPYLCQINYKKSFDYIVNNLLNQKSNYKEECYVALDFFRNSLQNLRETDNNNIYLLENKKLKKANLSDWQILFKKMPDFIKWRLGGQSPVEANLIPVRLQYNNGVPSKILTFSIEDPNGYYNDVKLIRDKKLDQNSYWSFPVDWRLSNIHPQPLKKIVELTYLLIPQQDTYKSQPVDLTAFSQMTSGDTVSIQLTVLPVIPIDEIYQFDFEQDAILQQNFKEGVDKKEWLASSLKLHQEVKRIYTFPIDFYSNLPFYKASKKIELLKNHLNLKPVKAQSNYCPTKDSCVCSEISFYQKEDDKNIYAESQCIYNTQLDFNQELYTRPRYVNPAHNLRKAPIMVGLKQTDAVGEPTEDQKVEILENFYRLNKDLSQESFDPRDIFSPHVFHVFFDLQAEILCDSIKEGIKKCKIRYPFETKEKQIPITQWNKPDKGLLSQRGLNLKCVESGFYGSKNCDCDKGVFKRESRNTGTYSPTVGAISNSNGGSQPIELVLDFECSFKTNQDNFSIELFLETNNSNIFLLNRVNKNLKQTLPTSYTIIQGGE